MGGLCVCKYGGRSRLCVYADIKDGAVLLAGIRVWIKERGSCWVFGGTKQRRGGRGGDAEGPRLAEGESNLQVIYSQSENQCRMQSGGWPTLYASAEGSGALATASRAADLKDS